jgi:predicted dehydrogenase
MKKYNVLIIGAGGQGSEADQPGSGNDHKIISFAHALNIHHGFSDTTFYDKDFQKAVNACEIWGGSAISSIKDSIHDADIAVITTPDDTHYEILKQLAEYPLKLVICEKPLCDDLDEAREIVELYKEKNIPLMVDYTRRFIPELRELKQRYINGEFGEINDVITIFNRGVYHTGSHLYDFLIWVFGEDEVRKLDMLYISEHDYRVWNIQLFFEKYYWQEQRIFDMPVPSYFDNHMKYVVDNAYNFLEGKEELMCTGEDALKALEICYELMEGANTNDR